jgi:hypothetical protein
MVKVMRKYNALVVGAAIEGHDFRPGWNDLRGRTCPWNTFAVWDAKKLAVFGFPILGDGTTLDRRKIGGVEEVTAITIAQNHLRNSVAVLTEMDSTNMTWNTHFNNDPQRMAYHLQKMASKDERPAEQLKLLDRYKPGRVYHMMYDEFLRIQQQKS